MTFSAVFLKFSAAVFKAVVDSFGVSSSSLALATLRDGPVYVSWLPSTGLSLVWVFFVESVSFFSPPVVPPVWFSFPSPPVGAAGLVLVFLAAALGVAEVDHVIVFAVF